MRNAQIDKLVLDIEKKVAEIKKNPFLASPTFKFSAERVVEKEIIEKKEKCDCKCFW